MTKRSANNEEQGLLDERVSLFLLDGDDPDLIMDLRKLNGKPQSSFQSFWDEVQKYFLRIHSLGQRSDMGSTCTYLLLYQLRTCVTQWKSGFHQKLKSHQYSG
jgi:hypothetical protein